MARRKCKHPATVSKMGKGGLVISRTCTECGHMLSLGKASPGPEFELRAARIADVPGSPGARTARLTTFEWLAYMQCSRHRDVDLPDAEVPQDGYAGWLAYEIDTHDDQRLEEPPHPDPVPPYPNAAPWEGQTAEQILDDVASLDVTDGADVDAPASDDDDEAIARATLDHLDADDDEDRDLLEDDDAVSDFDTAQAIDAQHRGQTSVELIEPAPPVDDEPDADDPGIP